MRPVPLLFLGIKRWQDVRPTDPVERACGGDFAAFAAYYGMGDAEAGSTLLYGLQKLREMNRPGFVGGSNFQIGWSRYEQDDEQVFP